MLIIYHASHITYHHMSYIMSKGSTFIFSFEFSHNFFALFTTTEATILRIQDKKVYSAQSRSHC